MNHKEDFKPGFIATLHTFGRDLKWNPHIHMLITEGAVGKFTTWAERMQNLDMLLLVFATDLTPEQVEGIGHEVLDGSGLIDAVKESVVNYHKVNEAISYNEGTQRALAQILKQLPSILAPLKETIKKYGKNTK